MKLFIFIFVIFSCLATDLETDVQQLERYSQHVKTLIIDYFDHLEYSYLMHFYPDVMQNYEGRNKKLEKYKVGDVFFEPEGNFQWKVLNYRGEKDKSLTDQFETVLNKIMQVPDLTTYESQFKQIRDKAHKNVIKISWKMIYGYKGSGKLIETAENTILDDCKALCFASDKCQWIVHYFPIDTCYLHSGDVTDFSEEDGFNTYIIETEMLASEKENNSQLSKEEKEIMHKFILESIHPEWYEVSDIILKFFIFTSGSIATSPEQAQKIAQAVEIRINDTDERDVFLYVLRCLKKLNLGIPEVAQQFVWFGELKALKLFHSVFGKEILNSKHKGVPLLHFACEMFDHGVFIHRYYDGLAKLQWMINEQDVDPTKREITLFESTGALERFKMSVERTETNKNIYDQIKGYLKNAIEVAESKKSLKNKIKDCLVNRSFFCTQMYFSYLMFFINHPSIFVVVSVTFAFGFAIF